MVQGFPELQGINQGLTVSVFLIKLVQAFAPDLEGGNALAIVFDPDAAQIPAMAQEKCPTENVCDFQNMLIQYVHLLP